MRFKGVLVIAFIAFLCFPITQGQAGSFSDNFNDGNANGWVFPRGEWSVENGTLVQRSFGDGNRALVDNLLISNQVIETRLSSAGYSGVVFWHQDDHWVAINLACQSGIAVTQFFNGNYYQYVYGNYYIDARWYDVRVDADSTSGLLDIYVNDTFIFAYQTSTPYRTGLSGLWSGNEVGYFDDFRLTSDDIPPVLIPINIDIKPESDPNSINLNSNGVVPVAILTTPEFDASTVDPTTVRFADASPIKRTIEDVDSDGYLDMLLHFDTQELNLDASNTEATLTGMTDDGIEIVGTDSVNIVHKRKK